MHLKNSEGGKSVCEVYFIMKKHKKKHVCLEQYCKTCKYYFSEDHLCYMQPVVTEKKPKENRKKNEHAAYIYFDFECTHDDLLPCTHGYVVGENNKCRNCERLWCGKFQHKPYGTESMRIVFAQSMYIMWHERKSQENTGVRVICHNFKGYDSYPIFRYLHGNAVLPKVITTGSKFMSISVAACNIGMIDSLNFIPMSLADMSAAFGKTKLAKG
ncbi:LOW QUALITY PROTEIN: hypothetical protein MAR_035995 [Mya arenaria]|uniref:DNA-directed DNA polymerase n=1 Tax=Mya arenaria TaxID=6604 RepID=A0ABY7EP93_MYAAR|nr:LOW QUALITY PROTEIN: hypothetical protein MAR_035995 [Mya arenaria]